MSGWVKIWGDKVKFEVSKWRNRFSVLLPQKTCSNMPKMFDCVGIFSFRILAFTRRGLGSQGYHSYSDSASTNSMSDSDRSESSSSSLTYDTDFSDYSFDAATNNMTWDTTPPSPKSPMARRPSQRWINQNYHIYCYPKMSRSDICDEVVQRRDPYGSPIRERRVSPLRVNTHQIFGEVCNLYLRVCLTFAAFRRRHIDRCLPFDERQPQLILQGLRTD